MKIIVLFLFLLSCASLAYAITPLEDSSGHGYTLEITGTGIIYDNNGWYNSSGNAASYLNNPPTVLINSTRLSNGTYSMRWRMTGNDYVNRKPAGFAMFSNVTQNHNIIYATLNTSHSSYGKLAHELRNRTNQNNYPASTAVYRNQTSWVKSTWVFNYTHLIYYEGPLGAVNTTTAIAGGVFNGAMTQMRLFEASGRNLNGSMDDIVFWNRTLTAGQVRDWHENGTLVTPNDVVYYYTFTNTTANVTNPCTYPGTGNFWMPCGCNITTALDMKGFNLTINTSAAGTYITHINGSLGPAGMLRNFSVLTVYTTNPGTNFCIVRAWAGVI